MVPPLSDARFEEAIAATGKALDVVMLAADETWSVGRAFARSVTKLAKALWEFNATVQGLRRTAASLDERRGSGTASPLDGSSGSRPGAWR